MMTAITLRCDSCRRPWEQFGKWPPTCPHCGSANVKVTGIRR